MRTTLGLSLWVCACICRPDPVHAQTFSFSAPQTSLSDTLGVEIVFNATCTNLSATPLTLMFVRTVNDLPAGWQSSLCLDVCYPPDTDTLITIAAYGSSPIQPGETRPFSVHVYPLVTPGTGYVRMLVHDTRNAGDSVGVLFTASALASGVEPPFLLPAGLELQQNYPNPFNPATTFQLTIVDRQLSIVKVFDVLGREVATLMNEMKEPGAYTLQFNGSGLSSGVYLYRLQSGGRAVTRKMVLAR